MTRDKTAPPGFGSSENGRAVPAQMPDTDNDGQEQPLDLPISYTRLVPLAPRRTKD